MTSTLAHLSGIDEIGVFLVPVILAILALRWAERRARSDRSPTQQDDDSHHQAIDSGSENE